MHLYRDRGLARRHRSSQGAPLFNRGLLCVVRAARRARRLVVKSDTRRACDDVTMAACGSFGVFRGLVLRGVMPFGSAIATAVSGRVSIAAIAAIAGFAVAGKPPGSPTIMGPRHRNRAN